jgi:hypothetical protein
LLYLDLLSKIGLLTTKGFTLRKTTKAHLITFSNRGYASPERILNQARRSGFFESAIAYGEKDIKPLIKKHRFHFLTQKKNGFGTFIWKPYIIYNHLRLLPEGARLVYADLGCHINSNLPDVIDNYFRLIESQDNSFGVFETGPAYDARLYVTKSAVREYFPQFYKSDQKYVYAGLLLLRNSADTRQMVKDWLTLCETHLPKYYSPFHWRGSQIQGFVGQDTDNGLLPLVLAKHGRATYFDGTQVNLYDSQGWQLKHVLSDSDYQNADWGKLASFPFSYRRDR